MHVFRVDKDLVRKAHISGLTTLPPVQILPVIPIHYTRHPPLNVMHARAKVEGGWVKGQAPPPSPAFCLHPQRPRLRSCVFVFRPRAIISRPIPSVASRAKAFLLRWGCPLPPRADGMHCVVVAVGEPNMKGISSKRSFYFNGRISEERLNRRA